MAPSATESKKYVTQAMYNEHRRSLGDALNSMQQSLKRIENKLFVDNGAPSMQTRLDRYGRFVSVVTWIGALVISVIVAAVVKMSILIASMHVAANYP